MSEVPAGHDDQAQWDAFQEEDPSYTPVSGDEPLDWGSDLEDTEACMLHHSVSLSTVHTSTALRPLPRSPGLLKDGLSKYACINVHDLSKYVCEHGLDFALCTSCKGKRTESNGALWILDSGASRHFTHEITDFIEYKPYEMKEGLQTAGNVIYVEGEGAVLVQHLLGDELVTTR